MISGAFLALLAFEGLLTYPLTRNSEIYYWLIPAVGIACMNAWEDKNNRLIPSDRDQA
jgi:hypothetical protein